MMTVLWIIIGVLVTIIVLGILLFNVLLNSASEVLKSVAKVFWR